MNKNVTFRPMTEADTGILMGFIWEMARYEHLEDQVVVTEELLREWLFEKHAAEVIFALVDGKEVGSALFFSSFSTFLGRGGLYLEDLIVLPKYRHQGCGKALLKELARIALDLALRSYANQLACARILDILQPPEEHGKKGKK